jgi:hypothetical protein
VREKLSPQEMEELIAGVLRSHRAHTPNAAIRQETITSEHTRLIARALLTGILFEKARGRHERPAAL